MGFGRHDSLGISWYFCTRQSKALWPQVSNSTSLRLGTERAWEGPVGDNKQFHDVGKFKENLSTVVVLMTLPVWFTGTWDSVS